MGYSRKRKRNTKKTRNKRIRKSKTRRNSTIYRGGELITHNINDLRELCTTKIADDDYKYSEIYDNKISKLKALGKGYQGTVYIYGDESENKVVKLFKLKTENDVPLEVKEAIESSFYASDIKIGPKTYFKPFITKDRKHVAFVMDKINEPGVINTEELIDLYTKSIEGRFVTFDFEFGRTNTGNLVFLDFGVSGVYKTPKDALAACLVTLEDSGSGYYDQSVEEHFINLSAASSV